MGLSLTARLVTCALAAACTVEGAVGRDGRELPQVADVPDRFRERLDVLLVVDTTEDAAGIRGGIADALANLHEQLTEVEDGRLDLHLGLVSSDLGAGGADVAGCTTDGAGGVLRVASQHPACAGLTDGWIALRRDGHDIVSNLPGVGGDLAAVLEQVFACLAAVESSPCAYAQPLAALDRALTADANAGFLRDDAALGVVFVAGEDDCSSDGPARFAEDDGGAPTYRCFDRGVTCDGDDVGAGIGRQRGCRTASGVGVYELAGPEARLHALRPSDALVVTGGTGGTGDIVVSLVDEEPTLEPACRQDGTGTAIYPSVRLDDFVRRFGPGDAGAVSPLCSPEGAATLGERTGDRLRDALGHRCLAGRIRDVDSQAPGIQWDCTVTAAAADGVRTSLQACDETYDHLAGPAPCFVIKPGRCVSYPTQLAVFVNWGGAEPEVAPLGVRTEVRCQVD